MATKTDKTADARPTGSIRLEGGGFAEVGPEAENKAFRYTVGGVTYDHVSEHSSGDWVYRAFKQ